MALQRGVASLDVTFFTVFMKDFCWSENCSKSVHQNTNMQNLHFPVNKKIKNKKNPKILPILKILPYIICKPSLSAWQVKSLISIAIPKWPAES